MLTKKGSEPEYLKGSLLIAMPDMQDSRFANSVILMIYHSEENAMGVVINKVAGHMQVGAISGEGEGVVTESDPMPVHYGGPVENERAIIVHSGDCREYASTQTINEKFSITTTPDILEDLSKGEGPSSLLLALGYAGWHAGQLESELQRNSWLICDGDPELVFDTADEDKWEAAIKSLGIKPSMLAMAGGTA